MTELADGTIGAQPRGHLTRLRIFLFPHLTVSSTSHWTLSSQSLANEVQRPETYPRTRPLWVKPPHHTLVLSRAGLLVA